MEPQERDLELCYDGNLLFNPITESKEGIYSSKSAPDGHHEGDLVQYTAITWIPTKAGESKDKERVRAVLPLGVLPVHMDSGAARRAIKDGRFFAIRFAGSNDMLTIGTFELDEKRKLMKRLFGADTFTVKAEPLIESSTQIEPYVRIAFSINLLICNRMQHSKEIAMPVWRPIMEKFKYVSLNYKITVRMVRAVGVDIRDVEGTVDSTTDEVFLMHLGSVKGVQSKSETALENARRKAWALNPVFHLQGVLGLSIHVHFKGTVSYSNFLFLAGVKHLVWSPLLHSPFLSRMFLLRSARIVKVAAVVHDDLSHGARCLVSSQDIFVDATPTKEKCKKKSWPKVGMKDPREEGEFKSGSE